MESFLLIDDDDLQDAAVSAALTYRELPPEGGDDLLPLGKYICIASEDAKAMAERLIEAGVPALDVSYLDDACIPDNGTAYDAIRSGMGAIQGLSRDPYFDETHTIAEYQPDADESIFVDVGLDFLDDNIKWRKSGEVVVCAGPYGCGKSTLMQMLGLKWQEGEGALYDNGERRARPVWFATWEDNVLSQKKQITNHYTFGKDEPTPWMIGRANAALSSVMVSPAKFQHDRNFAWYEDRARYCAARFGTNFFVLDPWSEFEHEYDFRKENETQYVKKIMRMLRRLSAELKAIFIVVTHLPKSKYSDDGSIKAFRVADALGSVQFGSSADRGICVLRTSRLVGGQDHMLVHFDKIKVEGLDEMGVKDTKALLYHKHDHSLLHDLDASADAKSWWERGKPREPANAQETPDDARPSYIPKEH